MYKNGMLHFPCKYLAIECGLARSILVCPFHYTESCLNMAFDSCDRKAPALQ